MISRYEGAYIREYEYYDYGRIPSHLEEDGVRARNRRVELVKIVN